MRRSVITLVCALMLLAMVPHISNGQPFDHTVTIRAPAVAMQNGSYVGTVSEMVVGISEGDGSIYVETWPLSEIDTQASARIAVSVAGELTGMDVQAHNFYYSIVSEAPVIGGPSAGGILTVATVACLNGWDMDQDVMMTGMINPDGSIGPVGGIYEKAKAAHEYGITTFLVPEGQATVRHDDETIDLITYAPREWGMEVKEVFDIEGAVAEFTGYTYEKEEFEGDLEVDTSFFASDVEAELALTRDLKEQVTEELSSASISESIRSELAQNTDSADQRIIDTEEAIEDELYYTSLSYLFQARISYMYVSYSLEYLQSDDRGSVMASTLDDVQAFIDETASMVDERSEDLAGYSALEAYSAAEERSFEAQRYLDDAKRQVTLNDAASALYNAAFAYERARTSRFWLDVMERCSGGESIDMSALEADAETLINDANLTFIYATRLNISNSLITNAQELLRSAQKEFNNGNYAAALYDAVESKASASVAIQFFATGEEGVELAMQRAKQQASEAIQRQQFHDITPVLSMSYFEYASTFEEDQSYGQATMYYKYAKGIANAFKYTKGGFTPGTPDVSNGGEENSSGIPLVPVGTFIIGAIVGIGAALAIKGRSRTQSL